MLFRSSPLSATALVCLFAIACGDSDGLPNSSSDEDSMGGSDGDGDDCPIGSEGCSCTQGGSCDGELSCLSGLCVDPDGGGGDSGAGGSSGGTGGSAGGQGGSGGDVGPAPATCGDGKIDAGEVCDDGNLQRNDGCTNCLRVDPGYLCLEHGEACLPTRICGDGRLQPGENCDDGDLEEDDGCDARCFVETEYQCEGEPSTCTSTRCGDGVPEGLEACDDGNTLPGDGCSETCQFEPECDESGACTTRCGDGIRTDSEECDDGNVRSGDGCNHECKTEEGVACLDTKVCEGKGAGCKWELPVIYRDFSGAHSDFHVPYPPGVETRTCDGHAPGIASLTLDEFGKPSVASPPARACISRFGDWYVDGPASSTSVGSIQLWSTSGGGFANRRGKNGEPHTAVLSTNEEAVLNVTSPDECEAGCTQRVSLGLRCENVCEPVNNMVKQAAFEVSVREDELEDAKLDGDPDLITQTEDELAQAQANLVELEGTLTLCEEECETEFDEEVDACVEDCGPCSFDASFYCTGSEVVELDGDPLFFPLDGRSDELDDPLYGARLPSAYYQAVGWPWEDPQCGVEPECDTELLHNFHFTTETAYRFRYQDGMQGSLTVLGDDDMWVYLNGYLMIDLGGIHVPLGGELTISPSGAISSKTWQPEDPGDTTTEYEVLDELSTSASAVGLSDGGVYEIKFFHAERMPEGSSLMISVTGLDPVLSTCSSSCGDGALGPGEQCDGGTSANTGEYNRCGSDCTLNEYCGDGIVQENEGEECDLGDPAAPDNCVACQLL